MPFRESTLAITQSMEWRQTLEERNQARRPGKARGWGGRGAWEEVWGGRG